MGLLGFVGVFIWALHGGVTTEIKTDLIAPLLVILILIGLYSRLFKKSSMRVVFERTSIPIGILFSLMIFIEALQQGLLEAFLTQSLTMLIAGCFVTSIGFIAKSEFSPLPQQSPDIRVDLSVVTITIMVLAFSMEQTAGLNNFIDLTSLLITVSPVTALVLINYRKASARRYIQAIVIGILGATLLGIRSWSAVMQQDNPAYIGPVIAIGLLSMLYSCLIVFFLRPGYVAMPRPKRSTSVKLIGIC